MSESNTETKRFVWLDILKITGILMVFVGHLGSNTGRLFPFVWIFHVPLLFFCSGYTLRYSDPFSVYVKKKAKSLLIPFYFFLLLSLLFSVVNGEATKEGILRFLGNGIIASKELLYNETMWFFPALFSMSIISYGLHRYIRNRWIPLLISVILSVAFSQIPQSVHVPLCANYAMCFLVYSELGSFCRQLDQRTKKCISVIGPISVVFMLYVYHRGAVPDLHIDIMFVPYIAGILFRLCLIIAFVYISKLLESVEFLGRLGRETLYFCGSEKIVKTTFPLLMQIAGLNLHVYGEVQALIYCFILIVLVHYLFVPVERALISQMQKEAERLIRIIRPERRKTE